MKASPDRITSPCRKAAKCQGCLLIAMSYRAQLRGKEEKVRAALAAQPQLGKIPVLPIRRAAQPLGYRSNVKLAMAKVRGNVMIGLYRRGSHEVVDIGDCPLHHPLINTIVAAVREEAEKQGVFVYDPRKQRGLLRYLAVRVSPGSGRAMVTFVTSKGKGGGTWVRPTHLTRIELKSILPCVPRNVSLCFNICFSKGEHDADERHVRLFRNGANQALRIPRDLELPGNRATIHKEGNRLIITPVNKRSLLATLAELEPLDEDFPEIEDPPVDDKQVF